MHLAWHRHTNSVMKTSHPIIQYYSRLLHLPQVALPPQVNFITNLLYALSLCNMCSWLHKYMCSFVEIITSTCLSNLWIPLRNGTYTWSTHIIFQVMFKFFFMLRFVRIFSRNKIISCTGERLYVLMTTWLHELFLFDNGMNKCWGWSVKHPELSEDWTYKDRTTALFTTDIIISIF